MDLHRRGRRFVILMALCGAVALGWWILGGWK
jgi:hypothetical protein